MRLAVCEQGTPPSVVMRVSQESNPGLISIPGTRHSQTQGAVFLKVNQDPLSNNATVAYLAKPRDPHELSLTEYLNSPHRLQVAQVPWIPGRHIVSTTATNPSTSTEHRVYSRALPLGASAS